MILFTNSPASMTASHGGRAVRLVCGILSSLAVLCCTAEGVPHDGPVVGNISSRSALSSSRIVIKSPGATVRISSAPKVLNLETVGMYVTATTGTAGSEALHFQNVRFGYNSVTGAFLGEADWPAKGSSCHLYASNAPMLFHQGGTTVWADGRQDIVCAYVSSPTWGSAVEMDFAHVFARLGKMVIVADEGWTVSDVSVVMEAGTAGTYDIRGGYGHTDGTGWSDVQGEDVTGITGGVTGTTQFQCFVVPGTYLVRVSWTAESAGGGAQSWSGMVAPLTLSAGSETDVTLSLGGSMYLSASVAPWDDESYTVNEES